MKPSIFRVKLARSDAGRCNDGVGRGGRPDAFAVADGLGSSPAASGYLAQEACDWFTHHPERMIKEIAGVDVGTAETLAQHWIDGASTLGAHLGNPPQAFESAQCTFLGAHLVRSEEGIELRGVVVGDCAIFCIGEKDWEGFNHDGLMSGQQVRAAHTEYTPGFLQVSFAGRKLSHPREGTGAPFNMPLLPNQVVVLATDALATWLHHALQSSDGGSGSQRVRELLEIDEDSAFVRWVLRERHSKALDVDDVAMVRLHYETALAALGDALPSVSVIAPPAAPASDVSNAAAPLAPLINAAPVISSPALPAPQPKPPPSHPQELAPSPLIASLSLSAPQSSSALAEVQTFTSLTSAAVPSLPLVTSVEKTATGTEVAKTEEIPPAKAAPRFRRPLLVASLTALIFVLSALALSCLGIISLPQPLAAWVAPLQNMLNPPAARPFKPAVSPVALSNSGSPARMAPAAVSELQQPVKPASTPPSASAPPAAMSVPEVKKALPVNPGSPLATTDPAEEPDTRNPQPEQTPSAVTAKKTDSMKERQTTVARPVPSSASISNDGGLGPRPFQHQTSQFKSVPPLSIPDFPLARPLPFIQIAPVNGSASQGDTSAPEAPLRPAFRPTISDFVNEPDSAPLPGPFLPVEGPGGGPESSTMPPLPAQNTDDAGKAEAPREEEKPKASTNRDEGKGSKAKSTGKSKSKAKDTKADKSSPQNKPRSSGSTADADGSGSKPNWFKRNLLGRK